MRTLLGRVSGLAMPSYVLDIPGGYGKSPIGPGYLAADGREIIDWRGERHRLQGETATAAEQTVGES